ncbi:AraC family transcriptional regulator [Calothrix sp. UHCC 0171]|uniref:helix-turn-helix transcriptional regulator n=1 Tax=Calothrix sp. UHCC 0171 TaxID=3110245 RepID=UPI002B1EE7E8|nr:AraC family transcriptional regulator [Calothrix sp. UHCC 0171]MEA5574048.1 AraC family transcriptional regulator [Calothrix sp. UHCC 0171]
MTITLSMTEYWELFAERSPNYQDSITPNYFEYCQQFPENLGRGYTRGFTLCDGVWLDIYDYALQDNLSLEMPVREHPVEFGIQLAGDFWSNTDGNSIQIASGESCLYGSGIAAKGTSNWQLGHHFGVCIHIEVDVLQAFFSHTSEEVPPELQPLIKESDWQNCFPNLKVTPAMQLITQQIINCPYQSLTKQMYLQSKVLELFVLHLEQLQPDKKTQFNDNKLKQEDIERIHQAKNILLTRCHNPPSLLELSREVGLNDFKLKIGFRHCFGTTVFGYLHQHRMEQAKQLLEQGNLTITGVARAVGYANRSHFAAAFKRKFGVNPSIYSHSQQCG